MMNAKADEKVSITSATIGQFGRYLLSAGTNHFISDQRVAVGGPGEAITAGELLLSSLGSCSLGLIQKTAKEFRNRSARGRIRRLVPASRHRFDAVRMDSHRRAPVRRDGGRG
jgi:hypothetical protein